MVQFARTLASSLLLANLFASPALAHEEMEFDENNHSPIVLPMKDARPNPALRTLRTSNVLMSWHGGNVLHTNNTYAIFWGSNWTNSTFAGDKITGIDLFFNGFGGSRYAGTANEYSDSAGFITASSVYNGHVIDTSTVPTSALSTSQAVNEICAVTGNKPDSNGVYFIYTSTRAGNVNYCAWHSWGNCSNGAAVQVAYMPNIDGVAGCDPGDATTGHSQGLSALANVTAHELMETISDPRGHSWYDGHGSEIGDKCAWSFPAENNGISTFFNGSVWKLQMEWSNNAYTSGTGELNLSGQKGCIY